MVIYQVIFRFYERASGPRVLNQSIDLVKVMSKLKKFLRNPQISRKPLCKIQKSICQYHVQVALQQNKIILNIHEVQIRNFYLF